MENIKQLRSRLSEGIVIPACPLALTASRRFDERRQRGLLRYYKAAGVGGVAVGVHTTQFAIHDAKVGLYKPVLTLAAEELRFADLKPVSSALVGIAGLCGPTKQAAAEAGLARELGFHAGLLSLGGLAGWDELQLLQHCKAVAEIIPLVGFYLQPAAGGRILPYAFWRRFAEIENVVAIKIAPFNRYQTIDVIRAVAEAGRDDIALYTGNDDNIVMDLLTPYRFKMGRRTVERRIVGGLLGHWAVWTRRAVEVHATCRRIAETNAPVPKELVTEGAEITDANAALFDVAHGFAGCIPGIHEVLRRQGLLGGVWCLDPSETLSPGQRAEIDRVYRSYPHLNDDTFVAAQKEEWLR